MLASRRLAAVLVAFAALVLAPSASGQESRVALVIGNGVYSSLPGLRNPTNDADLMSATLRDLGFAVIDGRNLKRRAMLTKLREFEAKLRRGGVGLFYFAGHGVQARGLNYLIPVDAQLEAEDALGDETVELSRVLDKLDEARTGLNLIILDACRDNPFAGKFRSIGRGLAKIEASGTLIAYATDPNNVASDGDGRNGVYTLELVKAMRLPGLQVEEVFKRVRLAVREKTANKQTPWENGALLGQFYFIGPTTLNVAPPPGAAEPSRAAQEQAAWDAVKGSASAGTFEAFLKRFPDGVYADIARAKFAELTAKPQQQALVTPPPAPIAPGEAVQELDATFVALRTARVRAAPAGTAKQLGSLAADTAVSVTGKVKDKDWLRIVWKDVAGYISAPLLKEIDAAEPAAWGKAKGSRKADDVEAFLKAYPKGHFAERASVLLASLRTPAPAPAAAATQAKPAVGVYAAPGRDCPECPEMVIVPAGSFTMGVAASEEEREGVPNDFRGRSVPQHRVSVRQFALGKHEVTFAEWDACASAGGCSHRPSDQGWGRGSRPAINVSWDDAQQYVRWLSQRTGKRYRLPSEAEWEYAARAGTGTARYWGDAIGSGNANCDGCGSQGDNNRRRRLGAFGRTASACTTCWAMSRSGRRIAGMRPMPARRATGLPGRVASVAGGCCAAVPGSSFRGSSAPATATGSSPVSGSSMPASAWPEPNDLLHPPFFTSLGSRGRSPLVA